MKDSGTLHFKNFLARRISLTMKTNHFLILSIFFAMVLLGACSKSITAGSKPIVIGLDTDYQATHDEYPASTPNTDWSPVEPVEFQMIYVEDVRVEFRYGTPTLLYANISGTWPGSCSQFAEIKQTTDGENFAIRVLATPDELPCTSNNTKLPFEINIPLNMTEKKAGTYTVNVNGKETSFEWSENISK
jgi:hypothetical protein